MLGTIPRAIVVHCNKPEIAHMTIKGEMGGRVHSLAA